MIVYFAGGISGNCKPMFREMLTALYGGNMDLYLAGTQGRRWVMDVYIAGLQGKVKGGIMDLYLAGTGTGLWNYVGDEVAKCDVAILESFYYADEWTEKTIPLLSHFMLDSGAFTFMSNTKTAVNFDEYLQRYINFIKKNKVKQFFELDVDVVTGYNKVKEMTKRLEQGVGARCIPVWHKSRGIDEWHRMTEEYDYVAIGGIVSKEIKPADYKYFTPLLEIARKNNCKVHGLGFTNLDGMTKYPFYSVDSTAWTTGNRFGMAYRFNGKTMEKVSKQEGQRAPKPRELAIHNFNEWVKFQRYARTHL